VCLEAVTLRRRSGDHSYYFISSYIGEHITFHAARLRAHAKALRAEAAKAKAAAPALPMSVDAPAASHDLKPIVCKAMVAHAPKQPLVCEMVSEKKREKKQRKRKKPDRIAARKCLVAQNGRAKTKLACLLMQAHTAPAQCPAPLSRTAHTKRSR
jgi:hypothetical protein